MYEKYTQNFLVLQGTCNSRKPEKFMELINSGKLWELKMHSRIYNLAYQGYGTNPDRMVTPLCTLQNLTDFQRILPQFSN